MEKRCPARAVKWGGGGDGDGGGSEHGHCQTGTSQGKKGGGKEVMERMPGPLSFPTPDLLLGRPLSAE